MSMQDLVGDVMRAVVPTVFATTGLQYKLRTSAAGVLPPTWSTDWTALTGQLERKGNSQSRDDDTGQWVMRHRARVTVADTVDMVEGTKVQVGSEEPFLVSAIEEGHIRRPGLITYNLIRDIPMVGAGRRQGGGL